MKDILIDCDPGHDDMIAIMVAAASPDLHLLGITTVAGNQTGPKTYYNARRILALIGQEEIALRRGADAPLLGTLRVAADIHGETGLDGAELPDPTVPEASEKAVDFLRRTIRAHEGPLTLVPTGPMTNIALLLKSEPELAGKIERIVFMGGAVALSNITPAAEFNVYTDPEAAHIVFTSGIPLTMIGLDATHQAVMSIDRIDALAAGSGRVSQKVGGLLQFYAGAYRERFAFAGAPIHDALAVAVAADPTLVGTRHVYGAVELSPSLSRGRTVIDLHGVTGHPPNLDVALEVDAPRFLDLITATLVELDARG